MGNLKNKRIGIAADRRGEAIAQLIRNMEGKPFSFPIQGKQVLNEDISLRNVTHYLNEPFDWVVLTTGIGVNTLENACLDHEMRNDFIKKLKKEKLAVRGSKTMDWLRGNQLKADLMADDGTMDDLLHQMPPAEQQGVSCVFMQTYNEDQVLLRELLERKGYAVYISNPYAFHAPSPDVVKGLFNEVVSSQLDAVVFTSKTQVRNLVDSGIDKEKLAESFNQDVLAVAVGKVTAQELENIGVQKVLQPAKSKMGAMVVELDRYFQPSTQL
ncbi:uroporphyrinogen-III synthase [Halobacillus karajensis]|uniref:uroporphyrinogen-III synthase n=1 Tax=Halobacillus karajensis TaxID=195088 RepID=UPI0008A7D423|nr:uroporphyrinogen-III synthase [Halobacillus karajensis]SEH72206.1 uroporphyrinogen-III synthase [Halobacillus karajensis]